MQRSAPSLPLSGFKSFSASPWSCLAFRLPRPKHGHRDPSPLWCRSHPAPPSTSWPGGGRKNRWAARAPVVVENRTGANGTIGSNGVARSAPDGYTLLAATAGTHVTAVHLMKNLPYDPIKDFTPIIAAVEPVTCLAVTASLPVNSVAGADRLRQSASGRAVFWQLRRRLGVSSHGRAFQRDRRRQDQARALSRRRAGHAGRDILLTYRNDNLTRSVQ